jgi:hypothetical protein
MANNIMMELKEERRKTLVTSFVHFAERRGIPQCTCIHYKGKAVPAAQEEDVFADSLC